MFVVTATLVDRGVVRESAVVGAFEDGDGASACFETNRTKYDAFAGWAVVLHEFPIEPNLYISGDVAPHAPGAAPAALGPDSVVDAREVRPRYPGLGVAAGFGAADARKVRSCTPGLGVAAGYRREDVLCLDDPEDRQVEISDDSFGRSIQISFLGDSALRETFELAEFRFREDGNEPSAENIAVFMRLVMEGVYDWLCKNLQTRYHKDARRKIGVDAVKFYRGEVMRR